jgi:phage-related tail protein
LKTLQALLIILIFATPLWAEQALVLTEIEKIQENLWYLKKDLATQKTSLETQQKELGLLASKTDKGYLNLNEQVTALAELVTAQKKATRQIEINLGNLSETLATLTGEIGTQSSAKQEQTVEIESLGKALRALQAEYSLKQESTEQALAETRTQLSETRSQLETMKKDVGGRVEQIGLWGSGAALVLAIILTIGFAFRRNPGKKTSTDLKHPPKHEM